MLMYFAAGSRDYGQSPIADRVSRPNWEFQAVVAGAAAPTLDHEPAGNFARHSLWVFPPGVPHGWASPRGRSCRVLVFHFEPQDIRPVIKQACEARRYLHTELRAADVRRLRSLAQETSRHYPTPNGLTSLWVDRLISELCWMAAQTSPAHLSADKPCADVDRVRQALAWFVEHLNAHVGVAEVARGIGVSPGHLRKIFKAADQAPPCQVLMDLRLSRAKNLLCHTELSLSQIARAVGLSGPTVLCRQFRQRIGVPPRGWARHYRRNSI